jgi:hypothetical protein
MSWENRKNGRFYYRAVKRNGRVIKKYVGCGAVGEVAAALVARARQERADESATLLAEQARLAIPERTLVELDRACSQAIEASLTAAGYHRVDYKWRRRYVPKSRSSDDR